MYGMFLYRGQATSQSKPNDDDVEMKESLVDSKGDPKELGSPSQRNIKLTIITGKQVTVKYVEVVSDCHGN